jgi:putative membrane protein
MNISTPSALRCALLVSAVSLCTALSAQSSTNTTSSTRTSDSTAADRRTELATDTRAAANLSRSDRNFFEKAAKSGMKEVAVSRSTLDRLVNPQVKHFAQMMVDDHSKANAELMALAQKKGVTLPPKDDMKLMEKWSKKTDEVDEDYMEEMVDDHQEAVELFEEASKSEDAEIAAFANKTLPTLRQHLTMAKDLKKAVD